MNRIALAFLTLTAAGIAHAEPTPALWGPHIDIEAKPGSKRTLGEADLFLPVLQDARTLVFANLRARFDNQTSREGNLGLGVRHMLESGWNLGAYGYADRRRSPDSGYYYNQVTLGAEALGRDFDLRANTYLPSGTRVRELSTSTVAGVPTATLVGTTIQVTTPGNITTTREERSLKGYDMEAGWRAPIFDSEAAHQLRLYVGGYRFSDDVVTVEGPRLRAELAVDDLNWFGKGTRLFFGLEAQHDSARGHQNFLSVRLRIPLGKESAAPRALSTQERRMTTPVMRDVDVVTNARTVSTTAPTIVETATATAGGQAITVLNSATTPNLQAALNTAGQNSTVILSGAFDLGNGNATLQAGQTVMGAGSIPVRTPSGRVVTLTASQGASISSAIQLNSTAAVVMADNSTLTGMTIVRNPTFGGERGVDVINVSGATLVNNTISSSSTSGSAFGVLIDGSSNIRVTGNTISSTRAGATAMGLYMRDSSVLAANNTLSAFGTTSQAVRLMTSAGQTLTLQPGSSGNVLANGECSNGGGGGTFSGSLTYTASGVPGICQ